jgi:uncharacterized protein (TIGR00255 family)
MIRSMTGFGEAQLEAAGQAYHLEIRSVNNRYFKAAIHLPEGLAFLEADVERLLRERLSRGSISFRMRVRDLRAEAAAEINAAAIGRYVAQLRGAAGADARLTIDLATLATLPGVCQTRELSDAERAAAWTLAQQLTQQALERVVQMRAVEGQALANDLRAHSGAIRTALAAVRERAGKVPAEYRERLTARIRELIAGSGVRLAEEDLLREVAIYADRSDVSEELSRLDAHLQQFDLLIDGAEAAGRKLEFIAQEMLREANTVGSKASDSQIVRDIIEIKSAIDRIKEQVQNIE